MQLLLDTHTFLWFITGSARLSHYSRRLIDNVNNEKWLSIASLWEIAIKVQIGKITLDDPFSTLMRDHIQHNGFNVLSIEFPHLIMVSQLHLHHRDPFDRLIIAQSMTERMSIVSVDAAFDAYSVIRLW